jgi:hypothetical protein
LVPGLGKDPLVAQVRIFFVNGVDEVVLDDDGEDVPEGDEDGGPRVAQIVKDEAGNGGRDQLAEQVDGPWPNEIKPFTSNLRMFKISSRIFTHLATLLHLAMLQ